MGTLGLCQHYLLLAGLFGPLVASFAEGVEGAAELAEVNEPENEEPYVEDQYPGHGPAVLILIHRLLSDTHTSYVTYPSWCSLYQFRDIVVQTFLWFR